MTPSSELNKDELNLGVLKNYIENNLGVEINIHSLMRIFNTDSPDYLYRLLGILSVKYKTKRRSGTEYFTFGTPIHPTSETITEMSKRIQKEVTSEGSDFRKIQKEAPFSNRKKIKCFFCFTDEDASRVNTFYEFFISQDIDVFFSKKNLRIGDKWKSEIRREIKKTDFFVLFVTQKMDSSGYFHEEIREAVEVYRSYHPEMPFFFPIKLEPCEIPPFKIDMITNLATDFQWIEAYREDFDKFQLINDIREQWKKKQRE